MTRQNQTKDSAKQIHVIADSQRNNGYFASKDSLPLTESLVEKQEATDKKEAKKPFEWSLSKTFALIGVIAAVILHLAGHISHETYLRYFGLDAGVFTRDAFATQVVGYYVLSEFFSAGFELLVKRWNVLAIVSLGAAGYFALIHLFMESKWVKRGRENAKGKQGGWRFVLFIFAMTMMFVSGLPVLFAATAVVLAIPSELATTYASRRFEADMKEFNKGCWPDKVKLDYLCSDINRDGKLLARGFLVDSSASHIALYDVNMKKARLFERDKTEVIGTPDKPKKHAP